HLDLAAVTDHALVLHPAVLAAGALPVLLRAEDLFAKQAVLFRPVGAVVDRLRLFDFAEGPGADVVRAGQADPDRAVIVDTVVGGVAGGGSIVAHVGPPQRFMSLAASRERDAASGSWIKFASFPTACSGPGRGSRA